MMNRRGFCKLLSSASAAAPLFNRTGRSAAIAFRLNFIISTCMYGRLPIKEILPEIRSTGVHAVDVWPQPHGAQREEIEKLGFERTLALFGVQQLRVGCLTRYDLGPFGLAEEIALGQRLGCGLLITGGEGPKNLNGEPLKSALKSFVKQMREHIAAAEEHGVTIAIENHGNNLIDSADSIRWLLELEPSPHLGVALAPYHLQNLGLNAEELARLIHDIGDRLKMFYAWQYGMGCMTKLPKEQELLQLPGRGSLDFKPILHSLREINYRGFTQVFMHPVPRGIPILPTAREVTREITRSQDFLNKLLE